MLEAHEDIPSPQRLLSHTLTAACASAPLGDGEVRTVELVGGCSYALQFSRAGDRHSTRYPVCVAVYEGSGTLLIGAMNGDGRADRNGGLTFMAARTGTHYVVSVGQEGHETSFEFSIARTSRVAVPAEPDTEMFSHGVGDLGDIAGLEAAGVPIAHFFGAGKETEYVGFELSETRRVCFGLRLPQAEAALTLQDAEGTELCRRRFAGKGEWISMPLGPGKYRARVQMSDESSRAFTLHYRACVDDARALDLLDARTTGGDHNGTETPRQQTRRCNADRRTRGVSLGRVPVGDGNTAWLRYRLIGGNDSGLFRLDEYTGELFFTGSRWPFLDGTTRFELTVRASGSEGSEDETVVISATEARESGTMESDATQDAAQLAPCSARTSLGTLSENVPAGMPVRYRLVGGNEAGLFELDEDTGELFFIGSAEDLDSNGAGVELSIRLDIQRH